MDQTELRELEYLCIQEEWAFCRAACPLHVDARSMCLALRDGDTARARAVVDKTMPIAGILGRICEAPCEAACKRNEAGGAVRIGQLEKFCVSTTVRKGKPMKVPDRGRRAAVMGCGISALTVAYDLARKGYRIHIFYPGDDPEAAVSQVLPWKVPEEEIGSELNYLQRLGVNFQSTALDKALLQDLLVQGPVYVGLESVSTTILPCSLDQVDARTLAAPENGLFVGGFEGKEILQQAIDQAASGRAAAVSMDRYTQQASLTADRSREGPVSTRLVTSLQGVEDVPPVLSDTADQDDVQTIQQEAARCLACECMICVRHCPYLEAFGSYPKSYARQIYNNESIVKGSRQANTLINSCMLCGLCTTLCPNDFPMADLCLGARQRMVDKGKMPPSAHDFALKDLEFSRSEEFFLIRGDPKQTACAWLFFPGCQLCATHPEQVEAACAWLRRNLDGGVGLALACCGAPAYWGGRQETFQAAARQLQGAVQELGTPKWIVACPSCQQMLEHFDPLPDRISLWEVFSQYGPELDMPRIQTQTCLIDPCAASNLPQMRQAVRELMQDLDMLEPSLNASTAACCGYGGLVANANPDIAARAARERAAACPGDALTYCAMCRDQLVRSGKRAAHLLDIFFPGKGDAYSRPSTGLSVSRGNRRQLKDHMLRTIWDEQGLADSDFGSISLHMSEATRHKVEKRRILDSDIQQVIAHAADHGQLFYDTQSRSYLASQQLGQVTFWVLYGPGKNGGYDIYTAYIHRMEIGRVSAEESA